jgi:hypothetical protein
MSGSNDLAPALYAAHERIEALEKENAELRVNAERWMTWRALRPVYEGCEDLVDRATGDHLGRIEHWMSPADMDAAADRLARDGAAETTKEETT